MFCTLRARMWFVGAGGVFSCVLECVGVCVTCCALSCGVRGLCCRDGASWAAHSRHALWCCSLCLSTFSFLCAAQCSLAHHLHNVIGHRGAVKFLMCTYFYLVRPWPEPVIPSSLTVSVARQNGRTEMHEIVRLTVIRIWRTGFMFLTGSRGGPSCLQLPWS